MTRHPASFENPLCREVGSELFFPSSAYGSVEVQYAKKICAACEHIDECREYGLKYKLHGVWGGTSVNERIAIRKKRNIIAEELD